MGARKWYRYQNTIFYFGLYLGSMIRSLIYMYRNLSKCSYLFSSRLFTPSYEYNRPSAPPFASSQTQPPSHVDLRSSLTSVSTLFDAQGVVFWNFRDKMLPGNCAPLHLAYQFILPSPPPLLSRIFRCRTYFTDLPPPLQIYLYFKSHFRDTFLFFSTPGGGGAEGSSS